jgi:hypothetical protein
MVKTGGRAQKAIAELHIRIQQRSRAATSIRPAVLAPDRALESNARPPAVELEEYHDTTMCWFAGSTPICAMCAVSR